MTDDAAVVNENKNLNQSIKENDSQDKAKETESKTLKQLGKRPNPNINSGGSKSARQRRQKVSRLPPPPADPYDFSTPGFRRIKPYPFAFRTTAKGRWIDKSLIDVFADEFRDFPRAKYLDSIQKGLLTVNGKKAAPEYRVKHGDVLEHELPHRHEPPVTDQSIRIIFESDELIVVDKPASIPVHPSGRYRMNTIVEILKHDFGQAKLHPIHRLDRLTSGILIIPKNSETSKRLTEELTSGQMQKTYLCRVMGVFPEEELLVDKPLFVASHKLTLTVVTDESDERGKSAQTKFRRLFTDGVTSVVECEPITGRTHQIRVHLQYLGHPIVNDPLYRRPEFYQDRCKRYTWEKLQETIQNVLKKDEEREMVRNQMEANQWTEITTKPTDFVCRDCMYPLPDPEPHEMGIYLHAYKYRGPAWEYQTDVPEWAKPEFQVPSIYSDLYSTEK